MLRGVLACQRVGFPTSHAAVFQDVATRMNTVISCREVGQVCTGLIEDGYALKGFRVDTKSCNWGPMAGFVCMDPRLNKSVFEKEAFNRGMTKEALSGAIHKTGGTEGQDIALLTTEWKANFHPLVISGKRIEQLLALRAINAATPEGAGADVNQKIGTPGVYGTSSKGGLTINWRLIRLKPGLFEGVSGDHYGIFVEATKDFVPEYFGGAKPLVTQVRISHGRYAPYHAVYGLTNPIPRGRNTRFKDCVTGDYDLFGVWHAVGVAFDGTRARTYVDGVEQFTAAVQWKPLPPGRTAIGMRINEKSFFKGAMRLARFTPRALTPAELLKPDDQL